MRNVRVPRRGRARRPLPAAEAAPRSLVIVPHGILHQLPFHALFDGQRYLLEAFEISYAPSATTYALCAEKRNRPDGYYQQQIALWLDDRGLKRSFDVLLSGAWDIGRSTYATLPLRDR